MRVPLLRGCPWLILLLLAQAACARVQVPIPAPGPDGTFYVVGIETLAELAARQGVPLEDLAEINGMRPDARLEPGQVIFLLAPPERPSTAQERPLAPDIDKDDGGPAPGTRAAVQLAWPVREGRMSSVYGRRWGKQHEGIDLAAPVGTPVLAAKDGLVLYADNTVKGYGNMVVLSHDGDLLTAYAHTSVLLVRKGDRVKAGQVIAKVGQTGHATAPHLHFEVRQGQVPKNPLRFLPPRE
jgi:LysM repeat protein